MSLGYGIVIFGMLAICTVAVRSYFMQPSRQRVLSLFEEETHGRQGLAVAAGREDSWVVLDSKGEQFFGILLEQIVIAVSAGLDIFPSICRLVSFSELTQKMPESLKLPYKLFAEIVRLVEAGQPLAKILREAAGRQTSELVATALYHLAVAHTSGGELARPLQELSDAFQEQLQERHEANLQRLPILATLPLLFIFSGMIVFTLGVPLMRIMDSAQQKSAQVN